MKKFVAAVIILQLAAVCVIAGIFVTLYLSCRRLHLCRSNNIM